MQTPADKTAKRISVEVWLVRYDGVDVMKHPIHARVRPQMRTPADRIAVRG